MFKGNKERERTLPGSALLLSFYFTISPPVEKLTTRLSARRLAPLTPSWLSYYDIPCGECVRSGCSDCCAVTAGAVTEGLRGPSSSDTCCDNMAQCFCTGTADVGSAQQSKYALGRTRRLCS